MTHAPPEARTPRLHVAVVLVLAAFYLAVLLPPLVRSHVGDDMLIILPVMEAERGDRSALQTIAHVLAPDRVHLPRALWKMYALAGTWLLGPTYGRLAGLGLIWHLAASALVWALARRLGLGGRVAWSAAGLHFTAYLGFHANLFPAALPHTITMVGVLALLNLYLACEQRHRAGLPSRSLYGAALLAALVSSLSRASSLIGPAGILAHALLSPGDARERLQRYDRWAPVVLLSAVYPLLVFVHWGDVESAEAFRPLMTLGRPFLRDAGPAWTFSVMLAYLAVMLGMLRMLLSLWARRQPAPAPRPRWLHRGAQWLAAALATPALLVLAVVFTWGVGAFLQPLAMALNSHNTSRWHMTVAPLDAASLALAGAMLVLFLRCHGREWNLLPLLVLLAGFSVVLYSAEPRPLRYWIYLTPVVAIVLAGALEALAGQAVGGRGGPWRQAALAAAVGLIALSNIAAIRLELWRHRAADSYMALDYVRTGDLIRLDLEAAGAPPEAPVCVDGLEPPPNAWAWRYWIGQRPQLREHTARITIAQVLGRRDVPTIQLDCGSQAPPGTYAYSAGGKALLRDGRSVDPFEAAHERLRDLVRSGDFVSARALLAEAPPQRPFLIRYLLEERLPDADLIWLTNGSSLLAWLDRMHASYDHWYRRPDRKVRALRDITAQEVTAYVRFLFLAAYVEALTDPDQWGEAVWKRFPFGALPMEEVEAIVRGDPFLAGDARMMALLREIATASPFPGSAKTLGTPSALTGLSFFRFLGRLVLGGLW